MKWQFSCGVDTWLMFATRMLLSTYICSPPWFSIANKIFHLEIIFFNLVSFQLEIIVERSWTCSWKKMGFSTNVTIIIQI